MKQGKTLTRSEKESLTRAGRNWKEWLSIPTECETRYRFINKASKQIISVERKN